MTCAPCKCKLSILGICLASVCSMLQVATVYLDKYEEAFDTTWFAVVSLILNCGLAGVHAFQIGLKGHVDEEASKDNYVETIFVPRDEMNEKSTSQVISVQ